MDTKKRNILLGALGVIIIVGAAIGYVLANQNTATTTNNVVINANTNVTNGATNENTNVTNENANANTATNANANTATNATNNSTGNKIDVAVNWHDAQKTSSLNLFVAQGEFNREDNATYYSTGTVMSGQYANDPVYVVFSIPNGPHVSPDVHYLIKDGDKFIIVSSDSSSNYNDDGFDKSKIIINDDITLNGITFPNTFTTTNPHASFARNKWAHPIFDASQVTKIFSDPTYGDVYTTKGYPTPSSDNDFSTYGFFIKRPDGLTEIYSLNIPFVNDRQVSDVTWTNSTTNDQRYEYTVRSGCGSVGYADVINPSVVAKDDLTQTGTTSFGDAVYELKDTNSSMLKDLYNNDYTNYTGSKIPYDEFVKGHPIFFWYDPFDRLIRFENNQFLPPAECGKPVIYLYPKNTTNVDVQVKPVGGMTVSDPAYNGGWHVIAQPNGDLTNLATGIHYPYLFWEGHGGIYAQPKEGWSVARSNVHSFLNEKLGAFGLNKQEIADFEEFWKPKMQSAPFYFITFLGTHVMNQLAPLNVTPEPDTIIRVLMDYSPLAAPIDVKPFNITTPERQGFTLVEWGGVIR